MTGLVDEGRGTNPVCLEFSKAFVTASHIVLTCQQHHDAQLMLMVNPLVSAELDSVQHQ